MLIGTQGKVGCAFVVLRPSQHLYNPELIVLPWRRTANYKVPRLVHFFDVLPVNAPNEVMTGGAEILIVKSVS